MQIAIHISFLSKHAILAGGKSVGNRLTEETNGIVSVLKNVAKFRCVI